MAASALTTLGFQIANFLVLLAVLERVLYRPALQRMAERRQRIDEALASAEVARAEGAAVKARLAGEIAALRDQYQREREEAVRQAAVLKAGLEAAAREDVRRWRAEAERALADERAAAVRRLRGELAAIVGEGLRAVLADVRGPALQAVFHAAFLARLAPVGGTATPLLEAAAPVSAEEERELARAIGRPPTIQVEPALVAGYRLVVDDVEVDGSLAGRIAALLEERDGTARTRAG